jgi:RimJ/RimL family protein N-acetyltransferase
MAGGEGPPGAGSSFSPRRLTIAGGRTLTIRASTPDDAAALAAMFASLDDDDLYRRFFQAHPPTAKVVEHIVRAAERDGVGLVAVLEGPDGAGRLVGEAGYELLPTGGAELGITVVPGSRGWLGPYLLDALIETARARGVTNLQAEVLVENRRMLALARARGYVTAFHSERPSIVRVVMGTSGRTPPWPGPHRAPRVVVEAAGGRWRSEDAARAAGFDVLVCPGPVAHARCPALAGEPCPLAAHADVIVDAVAPDTPTGRALLDAHARLHAGVPVCVELPIGSTPVEGRSALAADADDTVVVALLQRLARRV